MKSGEGKQTGVGEGGGVGGGGGGGGSIKMKGERNKVNFVMPQDFQTCA